MPSPEYVLPIIGHGQSGQNSFINTRTRHGEKVTLWLSPQAYELIMLCKLKGDDYLAEAKYAAYSDGSP